MAKMALPTPQQLRQLLNYDPGNGVLTWKPRDGELRWSKAHAGNVAGGLTPDGYIFLKIYNVSYGAHRVIWAMVTGKWPVCTDHRNGVRHDNRWQNLRSGTRQMNQRNQGLHKSNTSGRTGVYWHKPWSCWKAAIKMNNATQVLGYFYRFEDAVKARVEAERKHGFSGRQ